MHNKLSEAFHMLPPTILISCYMNYYNDEATDQYCVTLWQNIEYIPQCISSTADILSGFLMNLLLAIIAAFY